MIKNKQREEKITLWKSDVFVGESLQVDLDGIHEHICLSCIWETKRQCQGYFTAVELFTVTCDDHTSFTAPNHMYTSMYRTVSDPHSSFWVRGKHEICKVCTHTVLSYSTRTTLINTHRYAHSHKHTANKLLIPKAAVGSADSATQWLTFEDESPEPPKENNALPGMSRNVNCRCLSPCSDTDGCDGKARRSHTEAG